MNMLKFLEKPKLVISPIIFCIVMSAVTVSAMETLATYQQGANSYKGTRDAKIQSDKVNRNFGNNKFLIVQADSEIVSAIKFDLSGINKNSSIEKAELNLYLVKKNDVDSKTFTLKSYEILKDWQEGKITWNSATSNEKWGTAGINKIGSDRENSAIDTIYIGGSKKWYTIDITESVKRWIENPEINYGLVLRGDNSNNVEFKFASSEYDNKSLRPQLVISTTGGVVVEPNPDPEPDPQPIDICPNINGVQETLPTGYILENGDCIKIQNPEPTTDPQPTQSDWDTVNSWVYQLTNYKNNSLSEISNSNFDLAVIDLTDNNANYFSNTQIKSVKDTGKIVLAYMEIGAIESYRPEWDDVPNDLKIGAVDGWNDEQYVKYWDPAWWPIVQARIDKAQAAGFDGIYLDMIVTYEEIPAGSAGTNRQDLAIKMVDLIARVSQYAKSKDTNFKVVPQNSPELYDMVGEKYINAIDGLGMEEMYYITPTTSCSSRNAGHWCNENQAAAKRVGDQGKLVLSVDYVAESNVTAQREIYEAARAAGFVPYTSVRALNIVRISNMN